MYVNHWQIGAIHTRISTNGFKFNAPPNYGIKISSFKRIKKVGSWKYLIRKFVSHCVHEVVKNTLGNTWAKTKQKFHFGGGGGERLNADPRFVADRIRGSDSAGDGGDGGLAGEGGGDGGEGEGGGGGNGGEGAAALFGKQKASKRSKIKGLFGFK